MHHTRVLRPAEGLYAFYDGRIEGYRFAEGPNWVDEGALGVGIASYAVVSGDRALVYDTHTSIEHARFIRDFLAGEGVDTLTVVLSHWHLDHVAGTEVQMPMAEDDREGVDRKSTRLNSSHLGISYAVFCLKKKKKKE